MGASAHSLLDSTPDIELLPLGSTSTATRRGRSRVRVAPIACLLATGALLGLSTNLAKVAGGAGLTPLAFLAWSITGASLLLVGVAAVRGRLPPLNARTIEYFVLSAFVTIAASNLIVFSAVPRVGAAFVAPLIALPPLLTYLGALALGLERFHAGRAGGVALALAGVLWIALLKLATPDAATFWIMLTFVSPVLFAIGNLYRTLRWPAGVSADALAPGMLGAAALMLLAAGLLPSPAFSLAVPMDRALPGLLVLVQALVFAGQFVLLLELQRRGGPVYLSLFGPVGALVGIPIAVLLLGERPPEGLAVGAVMIGLGVVLLTSGGTRAARRGTTTVSTGEEGRRRSGRRRRSSRPAVELRSVPPLFFAAPETDTSPRPPPRRRSRRGRRRGRSRTA